MADKPVAAFIKLQIPAGQANPAPPVGPALGAAQVNIMQFCQAFNAQTQAQAGDIIPVEITVYEDRTFDFICKTPPAAQLIRKELGLDKGSGVPQRDKVGQLSQEQLTKIAEIKMPDLNANDIEAAKMIIAGTARSMGVTVEGIAYEIRDIAGGRPQPKAAAVAVEEAPAEEAAEEAAPAEEDAE